MKFFEKLLYSLHYRIHAINKIGVSGQSNQIVRNGRLEGVRIRILGNNNKIIVHPGAVVQYCDIKILGNGHLLEFGRNTDVQKNEIWLQGDSNTLQLGENSMLVHSDIAVGESGTKLIIGKDCMVAAEIRTSDGHSILDENGVRVNPAADIIIEDHVWVCKGSMVLKGVRVGKGSMVAARAMVTKDIPENSLAAGAPAKVIRTPIGWDRRLL